MLRCHPCPRKDYVVEELFGRHSLLEIPHSPCRVSLQMCPFLVTRTQMNQRIAAPYLRTDRKGWSQREALAKKKNKKKVVSRGVQ